MTYSARPNLPKVGERIDEFSKLAVDVLPGCRVGVMRLTFVSVELLTPEELRMDLASAGFDPTMTVEKGQHVGKTLMEAMHQDSIARALLSIKGKPVNAATVEFYQIPVPQGYTKQGEFYVKGPI